MQLGLSRTSKMSAGHFIFPHAVTLNPQIIECIGQKQICTLCFCTKVYRNIFNEIGKLEAVWLYRITTFHEFMVRMTHIIENNPTSQSSC